MGSFLRFAIIVNVVRTIVCLDFGNETFFNQTHRQSREFPFYSVGRIANVYCMGSNGLSGTCQIRGECAANGGIASGSCNSITFQAVCCVYVNTCGGSGSNNITYFQNSGYPAAYNGGGSCIYTVVPPDTTICQLRIDFSSFTLSQPDGNGICVVDSLTVTGTSSPVQIICGDNNGQHIYVSFSGTTNIILTIATTGATSFNRVWNLQLSLISCTSAYLAPRGCLQYYQAIAGEVLSLNYGAAANPAANGIGLIGTRQLANSNYGICIRPAAGQCSVTYNLPTGDPFAFTMTGDATVITTAMLGTAGVGMQGTACTTDYLIIPNPIGIPNDRFCGLGLPAGITSNTKPFVLNYITNSDDNPDVANRGFRLEYSQNACAIPAAG
ncbi:uncharacterized protein LOC135697968 [Ochlerotatus camptorhynchus]|uniref:uncharacterized protein LOC135697968 n=1 Tax=Ochlerotatus camptorhynchus TaxID=644619 RepID=UPI0031D7D357